MELPDHHGEISSNGMLNMKMFDAVAVGVGLGRGKKTGEFLQSVISEATCPLIIDADGIYHLSACLDAVKERHHATIITPHPGEMARLLGVDIETILAKPFHFTRKLAVTYHMY